MPTKTQLIIGAAPGCDLLVQGPGVAARHAQLLWRDGLWLQDLAQGRTEVDGRQLAPNESVQLAGFHARVMVGAAKVPLDSPEVSKLFLDRSALPLERPGVVTVGRDPGRAQVVVSHPTVSGTHLRVDVASRTVTDLGSRSGTFDRSSQRLPPNQPVPIDAAGGYSLGAVWIPSVVLMELAGAPAGHAMGAGPVPQTSQGGMGGPGPMQPMSSGPMSQGHNPMQSHQGGAMPTPAPQQPPPGAHKTMFGSFDLSGGGKALAMIGRLPSCDIVLPYPQVSSRHTSVMRAPDGTLVISDLGSTNGTYVNGQRLVPGQTVAVPPKTKIFIGPYPVVVDLQGNAIAAYIEQETQFESANLVEIEALDLFLKVPDRDKPGTDKILLNKVTFKALPGDLIALMGPSGAGKTTLLTVLNGYLRPTSGEVRVNGESLYAIYDALRGSIGYVPQDDLLHPELTVKEAISYSAKFRLPSDYSDEEIERRVQQTMKDLGLDHLANTIIGSPIKKVLSGGQRKRVNIALELVTDPALMFLDEPTSGLAADDTVALIDLLSNLAKRYGKTIIVTIHQPAKEEFEKFNLAFIMGFGGEPVYFGPSGKDSYDFFARYRGQPIDNPRDMFDQLKNREDDVVKRGQFPNKSEARLGAAREWRAEFYRPDNTVFRSMYSGKREPGKPGQSRPPTRSAVPLIRQFGLLLSRYAKIKSRDVSGLMIMLLQAPIIGGLLAAVFFDSPKLPNLWCQNEVLRLEAGVAAATQQMCTLPQSRFLPVDDFKGAIFFLTVGAIWFGVSNAAREVVSEIAIYRRERMVNLSIFNYMMSKFVLLSLLCVLQCTVLLTIVYFSLKLGNNTMDAFAPMLGSMILTSMTGVALGLVISTAVSSSEAAMALTPIALIPQVVLGGLLVPMTNKSWLTGLMAAMPSRWSFEGVMSAERDTLEVPWRIQTCAPPNSTGVSLRNGANVFNCAVEEIARTAERSGAWGFSTWDRPVIHNGVLAGMLLLFLALMGVMLRKRDSV
ncbi:MAG: ATP-binding cassette domain-containing protein [Deltaproteobacteria bacterium]|nr:ATP-binding cassette domain-containing protein [Myxococcales bacterium]MDP3216864.1 ATP-binding cassette domain-containing protein [Deltaproteobacteria bacterium]